MTSGVSLTHQLLLTILSSPSVFNFALIVSMVTLKVDTGNFEETCLRLEVLQAGHSLSSIVL